MLVDQLNKILQDEALWEPQARSKAAALYDSRVVDVFYDGLEAARTDFRALREEFLALPTQADGYRHVLLLGTTGAGKTTAVRQLLGTDPGTERFPSTSTAKTTVADTEIVPSADGPYRAVVTFAARDEVIDHLTDNVSAAALAIFQGAPDREALRRLLDHVNQRFRFSYTLGRPVLPSDDDDMPDDDDEVSEGPMALDADELSLIDGDATTAMLLEAVSELRGIVAEQKAGALSELQPHESDDKRVIEEILEEELDSQLRQLESFHRIVDDMLHEIELRFALLSEGELRRTRQGWPLSWTLSTEDRGAFLKAVTWLSSNYAPLFGRLLTPLVNGIRVVGPFTPSWADVPQPLVLIDLEGLGHTPKSASTLSTDLAKRLDEVDAILLVDNATAPMQAAPAAALKTIAVSGNTNKLHFLFTHFDRMRADNLPTFTDREEHIRASAENMLSSIGEELGPTAERGIRRRLERRCFFVGGMHKALRASSSSGRRTIAQLERLSQQLVAGEAPVALGPARPVVDRMHLALAVTEAARNFHARWRGSLGLEYNSAAPKEHWTRIKALCRRLGEWGQDEYDTLKPVAELRNELQTQILLLLERSVRWEGGPPTGDEREAIIQEIVQAVTSRLHALTEQRIKTDVQGAWLEAFGQQGTGSTFTRAKIIDAKVLDYGAPIPNVTASPDGGALLQAMSDLVEQVAEENGLVLWSGHRP
ncbi:hypothetical protein [Streptomyces sp. PKU-EA00015]|uniref:hypothetical protein n=1 Tax=Streptomyces sp. PKU-EA00015 TaxID=2748326 RepID=UPI0028118F04|nr:hypothetical protein [Streptomyces sp. PKU-EA00015]